MTEFFAASNQSLESTESREHWFPYLLLGLVANAAIWSAAIFYLQTAPRTFTSKWALTLPGGGYSSQVNLPNIGAASSQVGTAYGVDRDPRENYKFIAESEAVRRTAAEQLGISKSELGSPDVRIIDNSTLMTLEVTADTPEEAQQQSFAYYKALQDRLTQLRLEEADQRREKIESTLFESQKKLELAQQRVSEYKARSGLVSEAQINQLSANIEELRQRRAELLGQQQDTGARLNELSGNLNVSAPQAADAFTLRADQLFQDYVREYSNATSTLDVLSSRYGPNHPAVVRERGRQQAALAAMQARGRNLIGRPVSEAVLAQLNVGEGGEGASSREALFRELFTVQVDQQGYQANAQELDQQITQLERRLQTLAQYSTTLDALNRDLQVAETVFSSTLTGLDLGKSELSATYPQVQLLTEPSLPGSPTSPNKKLTFLGAGVGSIFITSGLVLFALRKRWLGQRQGANLEPTHTSEPESRLLRSPQSRSEVLDLNNNK